MASHSEQDMMGKWLRTGYSGSRSPFRIWGLQKSVLRHSSVAPPFTVVNCSTWPKGHTIVSTLFECPLMCVCMSVYVWLGLHHKP